VNRRYEKTGTKARKTPTNLISSIDTASRVFEIAEVHEDFFREIEAIDESIVLLDDGNKTLMTNRICQRKRKTKLEKGWN
jgi:hypothetical protein